ncbi:DUF2147 domain-containing protein [Sphingomonas alpina]|uniref:DUF2147 domain-containing protein n=1 Tax=Sphingomonas alpina TaxID=653931 RepID=A0A7H0LF72_9SPHN|nr:DUF2147 domain-containing protein [Sphingomonas alpina]QNQ08325.1 DUF2147 domain-containing protein [Sphingomonas alpina]
MRVFSSMMALTAVLATAPAFGQSAAPAGIWANPAKSVHVRFKPCGPGICGTVIWASPKAKADAQSKGTDPLVGEQLFRDFEPESPGLWSGEVFVPDIGKTFSGTLRLIDARTMVGEGCLFAGIGCRSQTWKRIK